MNEELTFVLRQLRGHTGLNIRDAAARLGIDASKLSRYESGERIPTVGDLKKLSDGYRLPADESERLYFLTGRVPAGWNIAHQRTMATEPGSRVARQKSRMTRTQIELAAYRLVEAFRTKDPKVWDRPPVPFERIAREILQLQIRIVPLRLLDDRMIGALDRDARSILIDETIKESPMYPFTVCHELGHWCLHENPTRADRCTPISASRSPREREADQFAAALLLPAPMVTTELRFMTTDATLEQNAVSIAARFQTSIEAATIRLRELSRSRHVGLPPPTP